METHLDEKAMETNAILNLLIRKGIISYEELFTELNQVKFQHELTRGVRTEADKNA